MTFRYVVWERLNEVLEFLIEARQTPAPVHQLLMAAGPGGMGRGVDIEGDLLTRGAIGGARLVGGAVVGEAETAGLELAVYLGKRRARRRHIQVHDVVGAWHLTVQIADAPHFE